MSDPPYAATNMDVSSAVTLLLVMPNSSAICSLAGAIMDEDTGLMNVNADTIAVAAHFLCLLQLENGSKEVKRAYTHPHGQSFHEICQTANTLDSRCVGRPRGR